MQSVNIFGCADSILKIQKDLPDLLDERTSIGLNAFPVHYPSVDYWMWIDRIGTDFFMKNYRGQKIITQVNNVDKNNPDLNIEMMFEPGIDLMGGCSVALYAIDWAIRQGYKQVYLYGVFDTDYKIDGNQVEWRHFYDNKVHYWHIGRLNKVFELIENYRKAIEIIQPLKEGTCQI